VERGMLRGIAVFRVAQWIWLTLLVFVHRNDLKYPAAAWGAVALTLAITAGLGIAAIADPDRAMTPAALTAEGITVLIVQCIGGYAYLREPLSNTHVIGAAWPIAFVLTVAVVVGGWAGTIAGFLTGIARLLQPMLAGTSLRQLEAGQWPSLISSILLYTLAGAVAGYVVQLLVRAEREVAAARARSDIAAMLHDGVLQTLALIERRAVDPELSRLAREQERELREFLFGAAIVNRDREQDAGTRLRETAARCEDTYGVRCEVVLAPDFPMVSRETLEALLGAVNEALTNAGKYSRASRVIVYGEPDDANQIFVSIRDDGRGFELEHAPRGRGISGSIEGRVARQHGRVEIESAVGRGTEVRIWLPL
jgi:signal transduction histidine kinase